MKDACQARRVLVPNEHVVWEDTLRWVDWALPDKTYKKLDIFNCR